ncbi:MAG: KH domain-containing protein [Desulfobacterales bacterium]|nr:KH domain-containing protein [Desulfobacterales bacterium]
MKDLITEIVQALVDQPEEVSVNEIGGTHTIMLEVRVAKTDMGKVIGKRGRTAQAIRTILSAAAGKSRKSYILEIVE